MDGRKERADEPVVEAHGLDVREGDAGAARLSEEWAPQFVGKAGIKTKFKQASASPVGSVAPST